MIGDMVVPRQLRRQSIRHRKVIHDVAWGDREQMLLCHQR
jgi:hypothetical protein